MSQCQQCGAAFYSASASWDDASCGDCLAARIELSLTWPSLDDEERKPMRRSATAPQDDAAAHAGESRRSA